MLQTYVVHEDARGLGALLRGKTQQTVEVFQGELRVHDALVTPCLFKRNSWPERSCFLLAENYAPTRT